MEENPYGYAFKISLYQAAMQGQKTENEVVNALKQARLRKHDLIAIIRGGGSKLDLAAFDNYNIAFEIAASDIPIISGIGHDIDHTVTDLVAHTVTKTPTAVADFIIEHNSRFENDILQLEAEIVNTVSWLMQHHRDMLNQLHADLVLRPKSHISLQNQLVLSLEHSIDSTSKIKLQYASNRLESLSEIVSLLDPSTVLERGYTLAEYKGKVIKRKDQLTKDITTLDIRFADGVIPVKKL